MTLPASDTFTGSDGTPLQTYSSNWSATNGEMELSSNRAANDGPAAGTENCARWVGDTFDGNHYSKATITLGSNINGIGVSARAQASNWYGYYGYGFDRWLFKVVGGTWIEMGAALAGFSSSDVLQLDCDGETITPKRNGSTDTNIGAKTDSSISGGAAGVCGWGDSPDTSVDNWEGDNIGGGGTTYYQDVSGTQSSSGNVTKRSNKTFTGSQSSAGGISKSVGKLTAGAQSSSGALTASPNILTAEQVGSAIELNWG